MSGHPNRPFWLLAGLLLALACGKSNPASTTSDQLATVAGFWNAVEPAACAQALQCGVSVAALAGCGFTVVPSDCGQVFRLRGESDAVGRAAGTVCYFGDEGAFTGTSPASQCLSDLLATASAPVCLKAAQAGQACLGGSGGSGGTGGVSGTGDSAPDGFLELPLSCRCTVIPADAPIPPDCATLIQGTQLGADSCDLAAACAPLSGTDGTAGAGTGGTGGEGGCAGMGGS